MDVLMPKLGLTMTEGTIVRWLKAEGEQVEKGEPLFEFETDKIALQFESPASGVLSRILHPAGATVPVLQPVARLALSRERERASPGRSEREGLPATAAGPEVAGSAESQALPGAEPVDRNFGELSRAVATGLRGEQRLRATPRARKLAEDAGIDLAAIAGTGPGGRIMTEDVERAIAEREQAPHRPRQMGVPPGPALTPVEAPAAVTPAAPAEAEAAPGAPLQVREVVPISGVRAVIARRMAESAHTTAATTITTQADATELVELRAALQEEWTQSLRFGPTYNDFLIVLVATALGEYPYMNAHVTDREIIRLAAANVGLAVDTERGLMVPVVKGAERMTLAEVARTTRDLVERSRTGKLGADDLSGGSFTITNLGMFDVDVYTPIINPPECAILGVGRILPMPVVRQGQICVRQMVTLSLTVDHRVIDGGPAARFLQRVKQLVERPYLALVR